MKRDLTARIQSHIVYFERSDEGGILFSNHICNQEVRFSKDQIRQTGQCDAVQLGMAFICGFCRYGYGASSTYLPGTTGNDCHPSDKITPKSKRTALQQKELSNCCNLHAC